MKDKIREMLQLFQKTYDEKNPKNAEQFITQLFSDNNSMSVMGTSYGETCLNRDQCRELFENDWKYWTFEKLNIDNAMVLEFSDLIAVSVPASFTYTFRLTEAKRKNYWNYIMERISETSEDKRSLKVRCAEINYEIAHIYHLRAQRPYPYRFGLMVSFLFGSDCRVRQILFAVPENIYRPDTRIYPYSPFQVTDTAVNAAEPEVRSYIWSIFSDYFKEDFVNQWDEHLLYIAPDFQIASNRNELQQLIACQHQLWSRIRIDDIVFSENTENHLVALANGTIFYSRNEEEVFRQAQKDILSLDKKNMSYADRIFRTKQAIAFAMRESSIGSDYEIPFRMQMAVSKSSGKQQISYLNLSYPFYYLLQDKNEFMHYIE